MSISVKWGAVGVRLRGVTPILTDVSRVVAFYICKQTMVDELLARPPAQS